MKPVIYILLSLLLPVMVNAQTTGIVQDSAGRALEKVLVINKRTHDYTYTDAGGSFKLKTIPADTVVFMMVYYDTKQMAATALQGAEPVRLQPISYSLDEVEIKPEMERYLQEHQEMLKTYKKAFDDAEREPKLKPHAGTYPGVTIDGLFTDIAARVSGKKKRDKHFKEEFERMEQEKFIAIRYNPELVMSTTHTDRDSAIAFIRDNPMELDFATEASALELQMWIRYNYKQWLNKDVDTPQDTKVKD